MTKVKLGVITAITLAAAVLLTGCGIKDSLVLSGTLEATEIEAIAEVSGKVVNFVKTEGDEVKTGDIIAELDPEQYKLAVSLQEAVVSIKKARLDELKAGTRNQQLEQAKAAFDAAQAAVSNAQTGLDSAKITYKYSKDKLSKAEEMYKAGSATENELEDARYKADTAQKQVAAGEGQLESALAQLKSTQAQLDLLGEGSTVQTIKAAEAELKQSEIALEQARLNLSKCSIKSPVDGIVQLENLNPGEMAGMGTSIATIIKQDDLWLNIYVPQKNLSSVSLGQDVELRCKALNDLKAGGKIIYISGEAEFTPKNVQTDESRENTVFRVKIELMDNRDKLKPGMSVDAVIG